jgi:hypothetical protein
VRPERTGEIERTGEGERLGIVERADLVGRPVRSEGVERFETVGGIERRGEVERSDVLNGRERCDGRDRRGEVERREVGTGRERGDLLISDELGVLASLLYLIVRNSSLSTISRASGDSSTNIINPASSNVDKCSIASGKGEFVIIFVLV